ncbi:RusA family crossover junction endodeoxyribonuclease [Corynebacterium diphtheriae]|nr:RusA family crossover junction endodeoxyribonuclease [Corynebacterium diphtheriae]
MTEPPISFFTEGKPAPQGSKNAYRRGNKVLLVESSKKLPAWRTAVKNEASQHIHTPHGGPIALTLTFHLPRPKTLPKKITHMIKKPDLDKLIRSTCDALTGTAYIDDNQINEITAQKLYAPKGTPPGCHITINRTPEPTKATP